MANNKPQENLNLLFKHLLQFNKECFANKDASDSSLCKKHSDKKRINNPKKDQLISNSIFISSTHPGINAILKECENNTNIETQPYGYSSWDRRYPKK